MHHITLLSSHSLDPARLLPSLRSLVARSDPLPFTLFSVGAFPSSSDHRHFLGPTPTSAIIHFHSHLCDLLRKEGVEIWKEYRPDCWVPYCAVTKNVAKARMAEAFSILRDLKLPVSGYAMDTGLVEFSPLVHEIFSFPLAASPTEAS